MSRLERCPVCYGEYYYNEYGEEDDCPECDAQGMVDGWVNCPMCHGTGVVAELPAAVTSGQLPLF